MEKIDNAQHIDERNCVACDFQGRFLPEPAHLDFYEDKLRNKPVKIIGYIIDRPFVKVILDCRNEDEIPFNYLRTYADKFDDRVMKKIWELDAERSREFARLREEKERRLSQVGMKVHVHPRYYLGQNFAHDNAVVVKSDETGAVVRLERSNIEVVVQLDQLAEYQDPNGARKARLLGERNLLIGRIESAKHGKSFGPHNPSLLPALELRLANTEKELTELGVAVSLL